jgi:uncharacterized protein YjbI with pentapeptide repeats
MPCSATVLDASAHSSTADRVLLRAESRQFRRSWAAMVCHEIGPRSMVVNLRDTDLSYAKFSDVRTHDPAYGRTDVASARWDGANLHGVTAEHVIGWPDGL